MPEVIHNTCNMGARDLPDMYALSPRASGIHIRQIPRAHVTTITYAPSSTQSSYLSIGHSSHIPRVQTRPPYPHLLLQQLLV